MINPTVNAAELEEYIAKNDILVVDFWTAWCGPCKQFGKIFDRVAKENPAITFANVNLEKESALAELFNIQSIPHLLVFKQGILVYSESGSMPESSLKELLEQALTVDVGEIRSKIDKGEV